MSSRSPALSAVRRLRGLLDPQEVHVLFIAAALGVALSAGFGSAVAMAAAAATRQPWGPRWPLLAQAHGHAQVSGFAGLFIMGMAYRLVPRFTARPIRLRWAAVVSGIWVSAGVLVRFAGQLMADDNGRSLAVAGAVLELAGALLFLAALTSAMTGPRTRAAFTPFVLAAASWFAVQAALSLWALVRAAGGGSSLVAFARDEAILSVQFYGFILVFILGVSARTVPVFFGRQPLHGPEPLAAWALLNAGVAAQAIAGFWQADGGPHVLLRVGDVGAIAVAAALLWLTALMGVLLPSPLRLRPVARPNAWLIRAAYAWLVAAALMLAYFAIQAFWNDRPILRQDADAVRHALALGVISMMIVAMAYLVVPALAMRRPEGLRSGAFSWATLAALNAAAVLRVVTPLRASMVHPHTYYDPMVAAGVLGLATVALLAFSFTRRPFVPPPPTSALPPHTGKG